MKLGRLSWNCGFGVGAFLASTALVGWMTGAFFETSSHRNIQRSSSPMAKLTPGSVNSEPLSSSGTELAAIGALSGAAASNKPLRGMRIVIDPGHGGQAPTERRYTGGTHGVATRQTESDVNLRVSLMLAQYLEEAGATVFLTRTTDNRVQDKPDMQSELDARSRYANSRRADMFLSVHHNHGPANVNYTAVFYHRNSPQSARLADQLSATIAFCMGTRNIGARSSAYRVLNNLKMPGVILEYSFMTYHSEDQRLANLSYNKLQAKATAIGVINYVRQTKGRGVDFTTVFGPLDTLGNRTQVVADSTYRGEGPPPSAPFFGRRDRVPVEDTALAGILPTPPSAGLEASPTRPGNESGETIADLAPLPSGTSTRPEAIRQAASQSTARSTSPPTNRATPSRAAAQSSPARISQTRSAGTGAAAAGRSSNNSQTATRSGSGSSTASSASRTATSPRPTNSTPNRNATSQTRNASTAGSQNHRSGSSVTPSRATNSSTAKPASSSTARSVPGQVVARSGGASGARPPSASTNSRSTPPINRSGASSAPRR